MATPLIAVGVVVVFWIGVMAASQRIVLPESRVAAAPGLVGARSGAPAVSLPMPPASVIPDRSAAAPPVAIGISAIGLEAPVDPLGVDGDGAILVPTDFARVGWWADGSAPGQPGPAVLVGHLDSRTGPAVFFELDQLVPGDEVRLEQAMGTSIVYTVDRIASYDKDRFPTLEVYGPTEASTLRLVTCSGGFDRSTRHYRENLVVYATLRS